MNIKRIVSSLMISLLLGVLLTSFYMKKFENYELTYNISYKEQSNTQIFYSNEEDTYTETDSFIFNVENQQQNLVRADVEDTYRYLRVDLGDKDNEILIEKPLIKAHGKQILLNKDLLVLSNQIESLSYQDGTYDIAVKGEDPYLVFDLSPVFGELQAKIQQLNKVLFLVYLAICIVVFFMVYAFYSTLIEGMLWVADIIVDWKRILGLAVNDFKMMYAASYLGTFWAFVQPIVTVTIFTVIFGFGFRSQPVSGIPFALWLTAGIVPWFFFQEALLGATNSLTAYSFLVKKVVFKVKILPVMKILSSVFTHVFFVCVAIVLQYIYKIPFSIYLLQVMYYSICAMVLALGLSYITSALVVFVKDLGQVVSIILQFGMWATPIMYSSDMMGPGIEKILKLNPMYYIVEGYRDAFFQHIWFWEKPQLSIQFWAIAIVFLILGITIFKGLEKHFADVL